MVFESASATKAEVHRVEQSVGLVAAMPFEFTPIFRSGTLDDLTASQKRFESTPTLRSGFMRS